MIDFHAGQDPVFFKDPLDLFFLTPHDSPVIIPSLFPFPVDESIEYAIFKRGFELDVRAELEKDYGGLG